MSITISPHHSEGYALGSSGAKLKSSKDAMLIYTTCYIYVSYWLYHKASAINVNVSKYFINLHKKKQLLCMQLNKWRLEMVYFY